MGVQFFFAQFSKELGKRFPNLWGGKTGSIEAIRAGKLLEPYGWLNSLYRVAEKKIFDKKDMTPVESVKRENVLKVFTYLSWLNAVNDSETMYHELMNKKKNKK